MSTLDNDTALLDRIQRRVLWLAVQQIHHANKVRQTTEPMKVGGHQASCASVVTVLTTLFFRFMRRRFHRRQATCVTRFACDSVLAW